MSDNINTLIKLPYLHDWIWKDINFEYKEKSIEVCVCSPKNLAKEIVIKFFNVIAFDMISCDLWGASLRIDCALLIDEFQNQKLVRKVFEEKHANDFGCSVLKNKEDYIEIIISGISGDRFSVACEGIDVTYVRRGSTGDGSVCYLKGDDE